MPLVTGFDLTIDSAFAIRGATPAAATAAQADIRVRLLPGAPQRALDEPLYRLEDDVLVFSAPEAVYRCRPDEIAIAPRPGADPQAVVSLLIATALPAVLWLRGEFVLHAAAIVRPGGEGALAIMGPSGAGKSTVAAQLLADGALLLADDALRLVRSGDAVMASGLPGGFHLADEPGGGRSFHAAPPGRTVQRAPLRAALVLSRSEGEPAIRRLSPTDAIEVWLTGQHRPRIPGLLGRRGAALAFCAHLAERIPLYLWQRGGPVLTDEEQAALARELEW